MFVNIRKLRMFQIFTEEDSDRKLLQQQLSTKNGFFQVSLNQSSLISEILRTISYEFFQKNIPTLAEKVMNMIIGTLTMNCSFTLFREIMMLLKRQGQTLLSYQQHFLEMNKYFSNDNLQSTTHCIVPDQEDLIFQRALKGSKKTIQSDIFSSTASGSGTQGTFSKLNYFLNSASTGFACQKWRLQCKKDDIKQDDSIQLSTYEMKGECVITKNHDIEMLMLQQLKFDLRRQAHHARNQNKQAQVQLVRYNRLLKVSLMNGKLKLRKRK